jgi:uncharacterized membrane protein
MLSTLAVSIAARLLFLAGKSLWIDEALASGVTGMTPGEIVSNIAAGTPHPPMAFFVIRLSALLFGSGEFGLRLLIALIVASAAVPLYRLVARRAGAVPAFWAAMIWALSPFSVSLGQEAWVYGINAALTLWLVDLADLAWRGSRRALSGFLLVGIAGILTTHIFVLSVAAALSLYFTLGREERTSWKVPAVSAAILFLAYLPLLVFFLGQFAARGTRIAASLAAGTAHRMLVRAPSEFLRLLADGLLPEASRNLLERPRMLAAYALNAVVILGIVLRALTDRKVSAGQRLWSALILLLPLTMFVRDDPTVRQLALAWVPFGLMAGTAFGRYRWLGPAVALLCLAALLPYYSLTSFPYHPSDWRRGVAAVESMAADGDVVLVAGGKSTGLAWDYYAEGSLERVAPGGETPYAGEAERVPVDQAAVLDSLLESGRRVWILLDVWGGRSIEFLAGDDLVGDVTRVSPCMEIGLVSRGE